MKRIVWIDTAPLVGSSRPTGQICEAEVLEEMNASNQLYLRPLTGASAALWVAARWLVEPEKKA
jgi:hypothetical protein